MHFVFLSTLNIQKDHLGIRRVNLLSKDALLRLALIKIKIENETQRWKVESALDSGR